MRYRNGRNVKGEHLRFLNEVKQFMHSKNSNKRFKSSLFLDGKIFVT